MLENLGSAMSLLTDPMLLVVMLLAAFFGLLIGAIPGLTATLAAALLVPFTFFMEPLPAIASIITMSAMAIFAGDVPSALLRMPGTPSSAAYTEDAYRLTRAGKGPLALTVSLIASVLGGLFGSIVLIGIAPILGEFALKFTSYEYFWVAVLGLTAAVIISRGRQLKGAIALMIGLLMSTVGLDVVLGFPRFTFDQPELLGGINFIPAMIGLFGLSEVLRNVIAPPSQQLNVPSMKHRGVLRESLGVVWKYKNRVMSGNAIGSSVGVLPGAGSDIATWVAYAFTKNTSRESHRFGKGHVEPIVGASAANNAGLASAFIPTLAFGIPGDTITAILIGVLLMKGVEPGPSLFTTETDMLFAIYIVFILANILLLPLGLALIRGSSYVLRIPRPALMATIVAVSIIGSYAINNGYVEILIMLALGILGYLLERADVPLAPVVLGIVLGPIVERSFMQSVVKTNWDLTQFVTRPISATLVVIIVLLLAFPLFQKIFAQLWKKRSGTKETVSK